MNNGVVKQDAIYSYLQKLRVWDEDLAKKDLHAGGNDGVSPDIYRKFGDVVKEFLDKKWSKEQHYIAVKKVEVRKVMFSACGGIRTGIRMPVFLRACFPVLA